MTELILDKESIQEHIFRLIKTDKVVLREVGNELHLAPADEVDDCVAGLRGILVGFDEMSVDKFLERNHADKELDL